jgi:hypothetical protein
MKRFVGISAALAATWLTLAMVTPTAVSAAAENTRPVATNTASGDRLSSGLTSTVSTLAHMAAPNSIPPMTAMATGSPRPRASSNNHHVTKVDRVAISPWAKLR